MEVDNHAKKPENEAHALLESLLKQGMTVLPDNDPYINLAQYHVCSKNQHIGSPNHPGVCCKCGAQLYMCEAKPGIPKVCIPCYLVIAANDPKVKNITTVSALKLFHDSINIEN